MTDGYHHIAIISDQKPRTEVLSNIIENNFKQIVHVPIIDTENLEAIEKIQKPLVLLIDLMGTNKKSKEIILPLREIDADIKLIALHMYRSPSLVQPLYQMGINGYIFFEPSRKELVDVIQKVTAGETYMPAYLQTA